MSMIIEIIKSLNAFNTYILGWSNKIIEQLPIADFIKDALIDSTNLVPFLFVIFFFIELFEIYFSKKIKNLPNHSKISGPFLGALTALVPQCGFSVIASTLYVKKLITRGTLIAVYISTSDEAIPVLLAHPEMAQKIIPILFTKFILAIITGYFVDFIFKPLKNEQNLDIEKPDTLDIHEKGCCQHEISNDRFKKRNLILHPIKHTLNIFIFILIVTLILNLILTKTEGHIEQVFLYNSPLQPIIASIIGLIPNCAISILITMLYIQHAISFGSVIAGLSSSAGLGMLILLKKNGKLKDTILIISILFGISAFAGLILQTILN